jgi:capsular exopolysaccharide synthesis family protein
LIDGVDRPGFLFASRQNEQARTMELRSYIELVKRRRWIIAATVLGAIIIAMLGVLRMRPDYSATATLRITPRSGTTIDYGALEYSVRLKNTYAELAVSGPTMQAVQDRTGITTPYEALRRSVSVEFPSNNELMSIVARADNPNDAAAIANAVSVVIIEESQSTRTGRQFNVELVGPAVPPLGADMAGGLLVVVFGAAAALVAGLGLALVMENLDTKLHTTEQIESVTKLPILAQVPTIRSGQTARLYNGTSVEGEIFRLLRTNIAVGSRSKQMKLLMVTSAEPGEGKSLITTNLAYAMGQLNQKVLIVDGDMRLPNVHTIFGIKNEVGLSNVLRKEVRLEQAVQYLPDQHVHVLTSGPTPSHPADLLSSSEMTALLEKLTEQYDIVLLDTPAFLAVADSTILASLADGVVLVVRYAKSERDSVRTAQSKLESAGADLIGVVANGAELKQSYRYYQVRK